MVFDEVSNNFTVSNTIFVGANTALTTSALRIGNSTVNTATSSTDLAFSNTSVAISLTGSILVGEVKIYAGTSAPAGWLFCYGQAISRTTYAALFAILSTTYGAGDGSTTFNVPDLRGRVVAGQDDMGGSSANRLTGVTGSVNGDTLGGTGGTETHTLVTAEIPAHTHALAWTSGKPNSGSGTRSNNIEDAPGSRNTGSTTNVGGITINSEGGGGAHNNVQPTIILNYMIFAGV
jgi:microcystin-dependent protein